MKTDLAVLAVVLTVFTVATSWLNVQVRRSGPLKVATYLLVWLGLAATAVVLGVLVKATLGL